MGETNYDLLRLRKLRYNGTVDEKTRDLIWTFVSFFGVLKLPSGIGTGVFGDWFEAQSRRKWHCYYSSGGGSTIAAAAFFFFFFFHRERVTAT